jgi:hypothetical protein
MENYPEGFMHLTCNAKNCNVTLPRYIPDIRDVVESTLYLLEFKKLYCTNFSKMMKSS